MAGQTRYGRRQIASKKRLSLDRKPKKERQSLKYLESKGAPLSYRFMSPLLGLCLAAILAVGCKKKEEAPAVIEEAPAAAAPTETDTSATLAEEPALQQVGENGSGKKKEKGGAPSASAEAAGFSERGSIVVQVSVFKSARQASNLVEKLAAQGYPAYVAEVENPTPEMSGTYHRVRIGRFQRIADAKAFGENTLRPAGYDFWVDNKKNDAVGSGGYSSDSYSSPSASQPVEETRAPSSYSSEPSAPAGDAWGTPKTEEPAAPAADAWGTPKADAPAGNAASPSTSSPAPTNPDTGKVNLDEW